MIGESIREDAGGFDLVAAPGPDEVQKQLVDAFPYRPDALSRSLNGNHEMYGHGKPYRDAIPGGQFSQRETHC